MVIAAAAKALNVSAHTLDDLKRFAKAAPEKATTYLQQVETKLGELGKPQAAAAVRQLLTDKTGTLVERIAEHGKRLGDVFPASATDWGKVQQSRVESVYGELVKSDLDVPSFLTGRISKAKDRTLTFKTQGGQDLKLAQSNLVVGDAGLGLDWVAGLMGDGPISLQGTLSEDRKSFNAEGFALNTDGKFSQFTFGRVTQYGQPTLSTPRGEVTIENEELKKKLLAMPQLGVILPGAPEKRGERLVYTGNPDEFFALAKWGEPKARGNGKTRQVLSDMAYNAFDKKPVEMPSEFATRVNHTDRLWVRGDLKLDAHGVATKFVSSYVSRRTDVSGLLFAPKAQNADPVQAAVMDEVV